MLASWACNLHSSPRCELRIFVVAASVVLIAWGIRIARTIRLVVFPAFARPTVELQTEAPGLSTEEVESLVSLPIERALNGTPWVATIRSKGVQGLSSVVLLFEAGTDLLKARPLVQERLAVDPHDRALSVAFALLPLVFAGNITGHEIEHPMAIAILGGMATSTVLSSFFLTLLHGALGRKSRGA